MGSVTGKSPLAEVQGGISRRPQWHYNFRPALYGASLGLFGHCTESGAYPTLAENWPATPAPSQTFLEMETMDSNRNLTLTPLKSDPYPHQPMDTLPHMPGNASLPMIHRKEICAGCNRPIEDRFLLRVMDNSWHETCLQCSDCQLPLTRSCYVKDRKLFCKLDYDKYYGTKCTGCGQSIPANELVMRAVGNVYHLPCFVCAVCGHQLQKGDQYVFKDGQLFCRLDFEKEFALMALPHKNDWCSPFSPKSDDDSSLEDGDGLESSKGPKRPRTILTTSQRRKFKASFEVNPKPCRKVREALAAETGLSVRVVQVWFQNQRAKVKKLARRQNQDTNGDGKKNNNNNNNQKPGAKRKKEDDDLDDSKTQTDSDSLNNLSEMADGQQYTGGLRPYDAPASQGTLFSPGMNDGIYEGSMGMEGNLDNIDDVLLGNQAPSNGSGAQGSLVNPIDKLYSMQTSYFTAE